MLTKKNIIFLKNRNFKRGHTERENSYYYYLNDESNNERICNIYYNKETHKFDIQKRHKYYYDTFHIYNDCSFSKIENILMTRKEKIERYLSK